VVENTTAGERPAVTRLARCFSHHSVFAACCRARCPGGADAGRIESDPAPKHAGYETFQTGDGLEAISLALTHSPDLILMDIQLPEISGLEVTRRLRGDNRSRHIPIVAVTAFAMGWHQREALDSGCDAYISKPISIFGFLSTVESFLPRFLH
jgi:two-component system cell cycle response regulator DivK